MNLMEIKGDLFRTNIKTKAHCISVDLGMAKGIAVDFCKRYGAKTHMEKIAKTRRIKIGDAVAFHHNGETIYQLITKERYFQKPTKKDFENTLINLRESLIQNDIKELAIPKIGAGLDKLDWGWVKETIQDVFKDTDINIIVYYK